MSSLRYIYCLIDPRTDAPFYVGQTKHPELRLAEHKQNAIDTAREYLNAKSSLIRDILGSGHEIRMSILETTSDQDVDSREVYWFTQLKDGGCNLLNWIVTESLIGNAHTDFPRTEYLTCRECASMLNISVIEFKAMIRSGKYPAIKIGRNSYLVSAQQFNSISSLSLANGVKLAER